MSTISELIVKIGADNSGLNKGLQESKQQLDKTFSDISPMQATEGAINSVGDSVTGLIGKFNGLIALAAGGFGFSSLIESAVNAGAGVQQLADTLNVSAAEAGQLSRIMKLTGADAGTAGTAMMRLGKTYAESGDAGKRCRDMLSAVGVSLTDQNGKLKPLTEQLKDLSEGYQKATEVGYGQEFIMSTLGARGMSLIPTLKNYAEAAKAASSIEGIGLDPQAMKEMQMQMRQMDMQAGQLKIAMGSIFASILGDDIGKITNEFAYLAKEFRENREQVKYWTTEIMHAVVAYTALKTAAAAGRKAGDIFSAAKGALNPSRTEQVVSAASDTALTAQQEKQIIARQKMVDVAAKKEEAAYYKTVQAMEISEAEKTEIFTKYLMQRETASMEEQAAIRVSMEEMFAQQSTMAETAAAQQTAAINSVTVAAEESAAVQRGLSEEVAASKETEIAANAEVALSEGETGVAAEEAAAVKTVAARESVAASETEIAANAEVTISEGETGVAAEEAAAVKTVASDEAVVATESEIVGQQELQGEHAMTGAAAEEAAVAEEVSCARAGTAVRGLTVAVSLLKSQWMLVAIATYEAIRALTAYNRAQAEKLTSNDGYDYEVDGTHYVLKNGDWYERYEYDAPTTDTFGTRMQHYVGVSDTPVDRESELHGKLEDIYNDPDVHGNDEDAQAGYAKDAAEKKMEEQNAALEAKMAELTAAREKAASSGRGAGAPRSAASATPKEEQQIAAQVTVPAVDMLENDALYRVGEVIGTNMCAHFVSSVLANRGIMNIGTDSVPDMVSQAQALGVWHPGDGTGRQSGDIIIWNSMGYNYGHAGIARADGGYIAHNNASTGVVNAPGKDRTSGDFGGVSGYIDVHTLAQGHTATVDASGTRAQVQAAKKKAKDLEDADKLLNEMEYHNVEDCITDYDKAMHKVAQDNEKRRAKIQSLADSGSLSQDQVNALNVQYSAAQKVDKEKVIKEWEKAWKEIKIETEKNKAEIEDNYEAAAMAEADAAGKKLADEYEKKLKAIPKGFGDSEGIRLVDKWLAGQQKKIKIDLEINLSQAELKKLDALAGKGKLSALADQGDYNRGRIQDGEQYEDRIKLAKLYQKTILDSNKTIQNSIGEIASTSYESMASSLQDFIKGSQGAMSVIHSLGNTILSEMSRIAANRLAGQLFSSIFSNYFGTKFNLGSGISMGADMGTGTVGGMALPDFTDSVYAFASGGIVTAPTLGLIGEAGYKEAVVPLTDGNLKSMGGGSTGKVVVNITNNSDSKPRVAGSRYDSGLNAMILDVVIDGATRNVGGFGTNMKAALK